MDNSTESGAARAASAEALLDRVAGLWKRGQVAHRDTLLECGRLLHEFVLAGLRETKKTQNAAQKHGVTRQGLVAQAAARLNVLPGRVLRLIAARMAVELLGGGEDLGALTWGSVHLFAPFVRRQSLTQGGAKQRPAEDGEVWQVVPVTAAAAGQLFRRAVREGLSREQLRPLTYRLSDRQGPAKGKGRPRAKEAGRLKAIGLVASTGDLAEVISDALKGRDDWEAVLDRVCSLLEAETRRARRLYEAG